MKRISSRGTFIYKRVIPILWFGGLIAFALNGVFASTPERGVFIWDFIVIVFFGVFGFFFMKMTVLDLVDEVFDAGDALVVRVGKDKQRIPLAEIANVSYSPTMSPPRVVLTIMDASKFSREVVFSPPAIIVPFTKSPIVADLIERIDAARKNGINSQR